MSDTPGPIGGVSDEQAAANAAQGQQVQRPAAPQAPAGVDPAVLKIFLDQQREAILAEVKSMAAPQEPAKPPADPSTNERLEMQADELAKLRQELQAEREGRFKADSRSRAVQALDANHFTDDARTFVLNDVVSKIENVDGQAMIKTQVPVVEGSDVMTTKYITPDDYIAQLAVKHPALISADKKLGMGAGARGNTPHQQAQQPFDANKYANVTRHDIAKNAALGREIFNNDPDLYAKIMNEGVLDRLRFGKPKQ